MRPEEIRLRVATPDDAEKIRAVYAPYVRETAITFEYEVPAVDEFRSRIAHTLQKYPYIVAERNGEILGYAYTGAFVGRAAYDWAIETSIYVGMDLRKMGLGKRLYNAIEAISRAQHIINLNACIGSTDVPDAHLNNNSAEFHAHLGYRMVGEFRQCGYKFGRWYNMVWMEKMLGPHPDVPAPVIPFPELSRDALKAAGVEA